MGKDCTINAHVGQNFHYILSLFFTSREFDEKGLCICLTISFLIISVIKAHYFLVLVDGKTFMIEELDIRGIWWSRLHDCNSEVGG